MLQDKFWGHLLNVAVDATSTGESHGEDILIPHTTSGANRLMMVGVSLNHAAVSDSVSSITYNAESLRHVGTIKNGDARVEIWALEAPDVGTYDVDVKFSSNSDGVAVGVMTFTGVDQTTPLGAFISNSGASGSASVTVASAANELAFGVVAVDDPTDYVLGVGTGQANEWDAYGFEISGGGSTKAGAASVDLTWNWTGSDNWAVGGISIKPSATNETPADLHAGPPPWWSVPERRWR